MNDEVAHSSLWVLAAIMIVIASWIFYQYFAPKTWREWAGAGVVQAFIIALYAVRYGFPVRYGRSIEVGMQLQFCPDKEKKSGSRAGHQSAGLNPKFRPDQDAPLYPRSAQGIADVQPRPF